MQRLPSPSKVNSVTTGASSVSTTKVLTTLTLVLLFTLFMVYPLGYVLLRAFLGRDGLTVYYFWVMLESDYFREVIAHSLNCAITVTALCSVIAFPLAFLMARWRVPYKVVVHSLLLLPLILPPFVGVLGVRQIFGYFGTLNVALLYSGLLQTPIHWLGGNQWGGIVVLQVIHLVPILYISILASLRNAQVGLEEAAAVSGASPFRVFCKITLPLSLPGWFAGSVMVFVASFTDLGTPLLFEYRHVIPVQIYNMLSDLNENRVGYAFVLFTCVISIVLFYFAQAVVSGRHFTSGGRLFRRSASESVRTLPPLVALGILPLLGVYILCTLLPHVGVILLSFSGRWFMTALPSSWTFEHYRELLHHPLTIQSVTNSVALSGVATALTFLVGFIVAYRISRHRTTTSTVFEICTLIPLAVPGIVFAFGYVGAFSGTPLNSRVNPFPLLIAAYLIRRSPYMVRSLSAGFQEVSPAMEEAAQIAGASPTKVARLIVFPLLVRHAAAGAILTFIYCMLEVSDGLLLALEERYYPVSKAMYALMARPDGLEIASALGVLVMIGIGGAFFLAEYLSSPGRPRSSPNRSRADRGAIVNKKRMVATTTYLFLMWVPTTWALDTTPRELIVVSPHWEGVKREFARSFQELRRREFQEEVKVRWLDVGGTSDIVKYLATQFLSNPTTSGVDVMFGGGTDSFSELDSKGYFSKVQLPEAIDTASPAAIQGVALRGTDNTWFAVAVSTFGIIYNPSGLQALNLPVPTSWSSLTDPRYFGQIAAGDPRKSGSMHAIFEIILQGYGWERGWEIIRQIAVNVRNFSASATQVGKELALGEVVVGVVIDSYASELIRRLGSESLSFVVPSDYPALTGDAIAVLRGAPNRDLAEAFVAFSLSETGQRLISAPRGSPGGPVDYEIGKLPVMPILYREGAIASMVKDDPFAWKTMLQYDSPLGARRWNLVNDLFGAFVIDIHDRIVRTYGVKELAPIPLSAPEHQKILADPKWRGDPQYRSELLAKWSSQARAEFDDSSLMLGILRWAPTALFVLLLAWAWRAAPRRPITIRSNK